MRDFNNRSQHFAFTYTTWKTKTQHFFLKKSRGTVAMYLRFVVPVSQFLVFIIRLPVWCNSTKVNYKETILLVLDAVGIRLRGYEVWCCTVARCGVLKGKVSMKT
jgi:hypothetical protein